MSRIIDAFEQYFDLNGEPLANGLLDFFETGGSTVRKSTYSDPSQAAASVNTNPLQLLGDGRCPAVFGTGSYRVILRTAEGVQILTRDPVGGDEESTFGAEWSSVQVYSEAEVSRDGTIYYKSLTDGNIGNRPSLDSGVNWEPFLMSSSVEYDNSSSGLAADNVKDAIDQNALSISTNTSNVSNNTSEISELKDRSRKNLFVDGNFDLWPEGTSFTVTTTAQFTGSNWIGLGGATSGSATISMQTHTVGQTVVPGNPQYFYRHNQTVVSDAIVDMFSQNINNVRTAQGESITVSMYLKVGSGKTFNAYFVQNFGSGGSSDVTVASQAINVTTAWTKYELTFSIPSITGKTIGTGSYLGFRIQEDSNDPVFTLDIGAIQAEVGTYATDYEYLTIEQVKKEFGPFYENSYPFGVSPGTASPAGAIIEIPTRNATTTTPGVRYEYKKRSTPVITIYAEATGTVSSVTNAGDKTVSAVAYVGDSGFGYLIFAAGLTANLVSYHYVADARIL